MNKSKFTPGDTVEIFGLKQNIEFNGKIAKVDQVVRNIAYLTVPDYSYIVHISQDNLRKVTA